MPANSHLLKPRSAYIHVPFCARRCGYCNFTLVAGRLDLVPQYLQAVEFELNTLGQPQFVDTLFFGGGTPTQLPAAELHKLLSLASHWFPLNEGGEFSVEANPGELDEERTTVLAAFGVNRISLGAQSFDEGKLIALERTHDAAAIERSFALARSTAAQVSLDLIFAAPGERLSTWQRDLNRAVELCPDHLSTYGLTIEHGTRFWNRHHRGELSEVCEDTQTAMYESAIERITSAGFEHYEVSSFAQPGARCRHNQVYWQGGSYFGIGPGAAKYVDGRRETNHRSTSTYIRRMLNGESPLEMSEELSAENRARERMVFGLRMLDGINEQQFAEETGFAVDRLAGEWVNHCCEAGWLRRQAGRLQLTRSGLMISDSLWTELLKN